MSTTATRRVPKAAEAGDPGGFLAQRALVAEDGEQAPLRGLRQAAFASFQERGLPTLKDEDWRFSSMAPIARQTFEAASRRLLEPAEVSPLYPGCRHFVFFNGSFQAQLSDAPPTGTSFVPLAAQEAAGSDLLGRLGRYAEVTENPFVALNTSLFRDGALLAVAPNVVVEEPIQLVFLASAESGRAEASYPRTVVHLGNNSQATIVESFATLATEGPEYLCCPVSEIVVDDGAVLDHYRVQKEGVNALHVGTQQFVLAASAAVTSHSIQYGGRLVRTDTRALLAGQGADCTLNGIYVPTGHQHIDNHMWMEHQAPHTTSRQIYKGILDDHARAVFNGRIYVHKQAQKTDAVQTNRNLLLSKHAKVNSNPQLEIFADDVRCTHGSTTGQLDPDALFYLRSRGIAEDAAKSLLTYAFVSEVVEAMRFERLRQDLNTFLFSRLAGGEVVREAI